MEECQFEMKKMRYRIRDYMDIHSIAHSDFDQPVRRIIEVKRSLEEVLGAVKKDLASADVEVTLNYHESAPKRIPVGRNNFYQVLINLILETINSINGRGWIKINTFRKNEDG